MCHNKFSLLFQCIIVTQIVFGNPIKSYFLIDFIESHFSCIDKRSYQNLRGQFLFLRNDIFPFEIFCSCRFQHPIPKSVLFSSGQLPSAVSLDSLLFSGCQWVPCKGQLEEHPAYKDQVPYSSFMTESTHQDQRAMIKAFHHSSTSAPHAQGCSIMSI